ncbi:MAG TPA: hypothetical protein VN822_05975 [Candidatus Acidoferrales bacterium]|nr:hypothetical protein [Candidatus Acidoferrales bacterium]
MRVLEASAVYFALVFAAGFVLGAIRTLWIVPRLGARTAELMETPVMLAVTFFAARWIVGWFALPPAWPGRVGVGLIALGLLLVAEFTVVLRLRGLTIREYLATQDPVSGTAYFISLALFAAMPALVAQK